MLAAPEVVALSDKETKKETENVSRETLSSRLCKETLLNRQVPALLIVAGLPATGKTTLARRIATQFTLPLIAKDSIKETLGEVLGCDDLAESRRLGRASIVLLYQFAQILLEACQSCLIEGYLYPNLAAQDLDALQQRCPFQALQIYCSTSPSIIVRRYQQRLESGQRHSVHMDASYLQAVDPTIQPELFRPLPLNCPLIEIDTTDFATINYAALFTQIQMFLTERRLPPLEETP